MNDTEQQIALCEWIGFRWELLGQGKFGLRKHTTNPLLERPPITQWHEAWNTNLPDTNSLDVLHEMEKKLNPEQETLYVHLLAQAIMSEAYENDPRWLKSNLSSTDSTYRATASQRREALLRTLKL